MQVLTDGELSCGSDKEEHNVWNKVMGICFHFRGRRPFQGNVTDMELGGWRYRATWRSTPQLRIDLATFCCCTPGVAFEQI